jgi:hypothetical protein
MVCLSLFTQVITATGLLAQYAFALPSPTVRHATRADGPLATFIEKNRPVSLQGILDNIGPDGAKVAGAFPGLVIASPSKVDPDCKLAASRTHLVIKAYEESKHH